MKKSLLTFALMLAAVGALAQLNFLKKLQNVSSDLTNTTSEVGSGLKIVKGVTGIGLDEELTIGNSVALEVISKFGGLVRDEAITRRVNLIGKSLACYSDRAELNFHFGVLNSPTVNAFSTPGGYVFITKGLYDMVQNDDELAGVLGHEIAHVTERHALKIIEKQDVFQGITGIASKAGGKDAKKAVDGLSSNVGKITTKLIGSGYDQGQEYTADMKGSQLAGTVGYAQDGLELYLENLKKNQKPGFTIFPTHPPLANRIEKLKSSEAAGK